MVLLNIPAKYRIKLFISDGKTEGNYIGEATEQNIASNLQKAKRRARLNAYFNFFKDGGKINTKIEGEKESINEFQDFSPKFQSLEKEATNQIIVKETKIFYIGTKRYYKKSLGLTGKEAKKKKKLRVKRENWAGKFRLVSRDEKGRLISHKKWSPKMPDLDPNI